VAARFTALRSRDFRLLCLGQLVSLTGSQMQQVAVIWQLYEVTHHDPLALGALGLFRVVPVVLFALGGGVVADAVDRRKLMLASQLGLGLASVVLAVATREHAMSASIIYATAALAGAASAFEIPARQALLPQLVTLEELPNALSIYTTAWQMAQIGGPALGGVVLARWGVLPIYLLDVGSFFAVIGSLVLMKSAPVMAKPSALGLAAVLEGLHFMWKTPVLLALMLLDFVGTFFGGSLLLMPIFADQLLHVGKSGLGLLYAAQPIGAALVGGFMSSRPAVKRQGLTVLSMVALYGIAIAGFGASRYFPIAFVCLAISGGADTASMVVRQTLRQVLTPDSLRGRMTSINIIFAMGGPQLGEVEAGALARAFGAPLAVGSGGLICAVVALAVAAAAPGLRRYRTEPAAG